MTVKIIAGVFMLAVAGLFFLIDMRKRDSANLDRLKAETRRAFELEKKRLESKRVANCP